MLPPELFQTSEELVKIDRLLDDERFFAPFRKMVRSMMPWRGHNTPSVAFRVLVTTLRTIVVELAMQL